jgi:hypothetical protein
MLRRGGSPDAPQPCRVNASGMYGEGSRGRPRVILISPVLGRRFIPGAVTSSSGDTRPPVATAIEIVPPARCVSRFILVMALSLPSLGEGRAEGRGLSTAAIRRHGSARRWATARRCSGPAPRSQPVASAPRLAAFITPSVASGLKMRMLAAGPAHASRYSHLGNCVSSPRNLTSRSSRFRATLSRVATTARPRDGEKCVDRAAHPPRARIPRLRGGAAALVAVDLLTGP